jgi:DNA mismatch repair protein MutL
MPKDKWPYAVLFMKLDPGLMDVNVHPSKIEVRFRHASGIHSFIQSSIQDLLGREDLAVSFPIDETKPSSDRKSKAKKQAVHEFVREGSAEYAEIQVQETADLFEGEDAPVQARDITKRAGGKRFMQVYDCYVIVEDKDKLTIYDQHALHEGILEQSLRDAYQKEGIPRQGLLIPEQIDVTPDEKDTLMQLQEPLREFGFELQDFSGNTVVIHSVPSILDASRVADVITDILAMDLELGNKSEQISERLFEKMINRIACHSSVRAGQKLSGEEVEELLRAADRYKDSASCAHGRPAFFEIKKSELEKRFQRR